MPKNTGKDAEEEFEAAWTRLGKRAWLHRFEDGAELYAKNRHAVANSKKPSDYLLAIDGRVSLAEVKSSHDKTAFRFSLLKPGQFAAGRKALAAGGAPYDIYAKRMETGDWFRIPFARIAFTRDAGSESIPWDQLASMKWNPADP